MPQVGRVHEVMVIRVGRTGTGRWYAHYRGPNGVTYVTNEPTRAKAAKWVERRVRLGMPNGPTQAA